jgi:hypothetical protein
MSLTARKIIDANTIYTFLENSFNQVYNSLKNQDLIENENINFQLFRSQADFDGTIQVPLYAEDEEAQKKDFGLIRFITGQVDPSKLSNVFSQSYSFEMLAFESHREDVRRIFTSMASTINGNTFQFTDSNGDFTAFATVDEFPNISQTIDANGADKFIISLVFVFLFYQDAVHFNNVYMSINGVRPEFEGISFNRQLIEPVSDLKKSFETKYIPSRSGFGVNISGFYVSNGATDTLMRWIMDETKLANTVRFFYSDGKQIKSGEYLIQDAKMEIPFEAILQYSIALIPSKDAVQTHRGVYIKDAPGTADYVIGGPVSLNADASKDGIPFKEWVLEYSTNPILTIASLLADITDNTTSFTMPNADLIIKAVYEAEEV